MTDYYNVFLHYLPEGESFGEDARKFDRMPQVGDHINLDGHYYEVVSIVTDLNKQSVPDAYVKSIGDSSDFVRYLNKKSK